MMYLCVAEQSCCKISLISYLKIRFPFILAIIDKKLGKGIYQFQVTNILSIIIWLPSWEFYLVY